MFGHLYALVCFQLMLELHQHKPPETLVVVQLLQQLLIINAVAELKEQKLFKLVRNFLFKCTPIRSSLPRSLLLTLRACIYAFFFHSWLWNAPKIHLLSEPVLFKPERGTEFRSGQPTLALVFKNGRRNWRKSSLHKLVLLNKLLAALRCLHTSESALALKAKHVHLRPDRLVLNAHVMSGTSLCILFRLLQAWEVAAHSFFL